MKDSLSALAYFAGWRLVRTLPERSAYRLFSFIGRRAVKANGKSVQRLRFNLSRVKSELSEIELENLVSRAFDSYLRYWCDTFRIQDWSRQRMQETVTLTNGHLLIDPMRSGLRIVDPLSNGKQLIPLGHVCRVGPCQSPTIAPLFQESPPMGEGETNLIPHESVRACPWANHKYSMLRL
jgi:hypothetical protein